ncbi:MAG: hypothetical protein R8N23_10570 [Reichenbachiella sp.]|uniref:hypothetical protein n=1 Tax=Reichenbachiella sp. TaxID=2184521 RepID=UPI0029674A05|nr:hypothetical protein [Reichenbachiella sp.]MDW3210302.1 hypothetical protein [Reichenbachiella sp.]
MKASLALNHKDQIALFYDEPLNISPQWVSIDIDLGEIYVGGDDTESKTIKLDKVDPRIYQRVRSESRILLIQLDNTEKHEPVGSVFVPLMIAQKL